MTRRSLSPIVLATVLIAFALVHGQGAKGLPSSPVPRGPVPRFEVDPTWPQMPDTWAIGQVSGLAVDSQDHIWVIQRPSSLDDGELAAVMNPPQADCCRPAPPVLEFDQKGRFIQGWGGPGAGYEWPSPSATYTPGRDGPAAGGNRRAAGDSRAENAEHGIYVDPKDNVWLAGNGAGNHQLLKFTRTGKFLLQIGKHGQSKGSNDTANLNQPTGMQIYPPTNELFVSDGYGNRRVIVFDADTGAYKRHWGAYGNRPDDAPQARVFDGPGPQQFATVHGIAVSKDGRVYVGDRVNNRIQVFTVDGKFIKETFVSRGTRANTGTAFGVALSPDERFVYVPDGPNNIVHIRRRDTLEEVGTFGRHGRLAGEFFHLHSIAVDSKGNIYTGESLGKRAQRFLFKGMSRS